MAQPTNTFSTYDAVGNREDLSDMIYMISPTDTPVLSAMPKVKATATYHEWQTDTLAAASGSNAVIEGDDAVTDASTATTRLGNYTQISDKVARVTRTQEVVKKAGRSSEMARQVMKKSAELKLDVETRILGNFARVAGNDTTAREAAGIQSYITTNSDFGSGGADPTGNGTDTRTNGTQRAFTETMLKTVLRSCWESGGNPDTVVVGGFNKDALGAFSGGATRTITSGEKKIISAVDVYVGNFGDVVVMPSRNIPTRTALVLQMDMWAFATLRDFQEQDLAVTGDSVRKQIMVEYTLEARNEASSGIIADLTTS